jgi:hypothetical protein
MKWQADCGRAERLLRRRVFPDERDRFGDPDEGEVVPLVDRRSGIHDEQVHGPAELFETAFRLEGVLFGGDDEVVRADDMTQGDLRAGDRFELVKWPSPISEASSTNP